MHRSSDRVLNSICNDISDICNCVISLDCENALLVCILDSWKCGVPHFDSLLDYLRLVFSHMDESLLDFMVFREVGMEIIDLTSFRIDSSVCDSVNADIFWLFEDAHQRWLDFELLKQVNLGFGLWEPIKDPTIQFAI